uniref:COP9 signalosome complex subunit 3, putative n=1 Tax=Entamoeba histolytica TaxID=5759 RepID=A0A060N022_ENTHI|nr:COP9 signalosome complex subunit 3, putative [Entamoeba histolytica]
MSSSNDLSSVLDKNQSTIFNEIKGLKFSPLTYERYNELLEKYTISNYPSSHLLILKEQTRTLNDKNLSKVISSIKNYHENISPSMKKSLEPVFLETLQSVERFCQRQCSLLDKLTDLVHLLLSEVPDGVLSPYHALLAHILFAKKEYEHGKILYFTKYHKVQQPMNSFTLQLFLYYSGCIALYNRDLQEAYFLFDQCITTPSKEITPQCVAAWKKEALLCLIINYSLYPVSKQFNYFIDLYQPLLVYKQIQENFINGPEKVKFIIEAFSSILKQDGNLGLAKQVVVSYIYSGINKVSKAFNSISVEALARRIHYDKNLLSVGLNKLIKKGLINASFDGDIIVFEEVKVKDKGLVELLFQLKECEQIYEEMKHHLTIREEEQMNKKGSIN